MASDPIQELGIFILDKFRHPNQDMRYLGAGSDHAHLEREIMFTLNTLGRTRDKIEIAKLLNQLRGHVLGLQAVQYYSDKEANEILDKIDKAEK